MLNENKPISIESLTRESLKDQSTENLEELLQYMTSIRMKLISKMELVSAVKESILESENAKKSIEKLSPSQRTALAQALGGDHIVKEEKDFE